MSREKVLHAALALIDGAGAGALTMRGLGASLGVEAMSLYHYVRNREDLLDGVAEVMVGKLPVSRSNQDWDDALRAFAVGIRAVGLRHPDAFQLVGMRPLTVRAASGPVGALLLRLRAAGLEPAEAVAAYRAIAAFARGFALAEIAGFTLDRRGTASGDMSLPRELAPFERALSGGHRRAFDEGLELLVAGIRTMHALDCAGR